MLLPAYQKWVPSTEVYNLVSTISKILPPLSDKDVAKLSITLPLLSASLEACELNRSDSRYEAMVEQITSVVAELASYALNLDYDARSRSAAAACLHTYIVYLAPREIEVCPVQRILENVIMPSLVAALESTSNKSQAQRSCSSTVAGFVDCLNLASVVVSLNCSPTVFKRPLLFIQFSYFF